LPKKFKNILEKVKKFNKKKFEVPNINRMLFKKKKRNIVEKKVTQN
jgi:hypothetical protein